MLPFLKTRSQLTVAIALLFHTIGLCGILWKGAAFAGTTPMHLWLMFLLLFISQEKGRGVFAQVALLVFTAGFLAEWIGVHTGLLFGSYAYGGTLGWKLDDIPVTMGCNWVTVVGGAVGIVSYLPGKKPVSIIPKAVLAGAIATGLDWVMEPIAMKLDYWQWAGNVIPVFNYACWFALASVLAAIWLYLKVPRNLFGINLFLIQLVFFLLLRCFL